MVKTEAGNLVSSKKGQKSAEKRGVRLILGGFTCLPPSEFPQTCFGGKKKKREKKKDRR